MNAVFVSSLALFLAGSSLAETTKNSLSSSFSSSLLRGETTALQSSSANRELAGLGNFFTYYEDGGFGPSRWHLLEMEGNQCGGTNGRSGYGQSPVVVGSATYAQCDTNMDAYDFVGGTCTWDDLAFSIHNSGVKVEPKPSSGCTLGSMDTPHSQNSYRALQMHIHLSSGHRIEGHPASTGGTSGDGSFPAELHFIHMEEEAGFAGDFSNLAMMISVGSSAHPTFEYFLQGWEAVAAETANWCLASGATLSSRVVAGAGWTCSPPNQFPAVQSRSNFPAQTVNLYEDLPTQAGWGIFTYKGSVTVPGCTEVVNINLVDEPMEISQDQLDRLEGLILCFVSSGDGTCTHSTVASETGSTSRPPQPLLGRKVIHRCPNGPDETIVDIGVLPQPPTGSPTDVPTSRPTPSVPPTEAPTPSPSADSGRIQGQSNNEGGQQSAAFTRSNPHMLLLCFCFALGMFALI